MQAQSLAQRVTQAGRFYVSGPDVRRRPSLSSAISSTARASTSQTFGEVVKERVDALIRAHRDSPESQRFIAIAGPPGGGKSTLTSAICDAVNAEFDEDIAVIVPMDGFHYPMATLLENKQLFPDAELAVARRGAPFTFDAGAFVECIQSLRSAGEGDVPTFDHEIHDPVSGGCAVKKVHKIILVEGNYLLLPEKPWQVLVKESVFDETWFVDTDVEEAMRRIITRHVRVGRTPEEAKRRADTNDRLNAELVVAASRKLADILVPSVQL